MGTAEVLADRVSGRRPSRVRAAIAAAAIGAGAAVLTYRLLRSGGESEGADETPTR
jgi:hypothetical protein